MNDQKFQAAYSNMLRSYSFGRHFWLDEENEICSAPWRNDCTVDTANMDYVGDWTDEAETQRSFLR